MKKRLTGIALLLLFTLLMGQVESQETVMLKYSFVQGKIYTQSSHISQDNVQSMGGQEFRIQAGVDIKQEFSVEKVEKDGSATVSGTIKDITVHTSIPGRDTTMTFNDLKEKTRMVIAVTGKILSTQKIDSSAVIPQLGQMDLGKLKLLPGKLIKVGEKWQDTIMETRKPASGNPFSMEVKGITESTLAGKEVKEGKEYQKVTYAGTMEVAGKGTQMGMELYVEGTGRIEGYFLFDKTLSMPVYSEDNTEMSLNIAVSGPQNMTVPMTQSIKMISTTEEKK